MFNKVIIRVVLLLTCLLARPGFAGDNIDAELEKESSRDCVLLVHGLGRSAWSMFFIARYLERRNYYVHRVDYPSTRKSIEQLAREYIPPALAYCRERTRGNIHFVTHSLGGILVRQYFQHQSDPLVARIVMLSPPNQGSEVTDFFKDSILYGWLNGPAGQQLTTDELGLPKQLQAIDFEIGVITGNSSYEPWFSRLSEGEDDGKVSVANAHLEEMKDFLVVPRNHTLIMNAPFVMEQVEHFLKHGVFRRQAVAEFGQSNSQAKKNSTD